MSCSNSRSLQRSGVFMFLFLLHGPDTAQLHTHAPRKGSVFHKEAFLFSPCGSVCPISAGGIFALTIRGTFSK